MATVSEPPVAQPTSTNSQSISWPTIGWFTALLVAAYFPILVKLVNQWANDADFTHGFLVPIVALYLAWQRREEILQVERNPAWWGIGLLVWGSLQAFIGMLGAELFLQRSAFLISLVGILLVLGGTRLVRVLAFPLLLLPFMIPIPTVVYNQITFPLQLFASRVAEFTLDLMGIPVLRDGNILELASQPLSVAEACSGIRSLLALTFMSLVYAYFFDRKVWMRWVLLAATIPIAIIANAGRVTLTGYLSEIDTDLATGIFHEMEGWVIFVIAFLMLIAFHGMVNAGYRMIKRLPKDAEVS